MVIVMGTFGVGMMIYTNVVQRGQNASVVKAHVMVKDAAADALMHKRFLDESWNADGLMIRKTIRESRWTGVKVLEVSALDESQKSLATYKVLIHANR